MTDLSRLRVSLTKHNAHKVAQLLKAYDADQVFGHLEEIKADPAQTRKNLSTGSGDILPPLWTGAQKLGAQAIDALVLLAIIFSHRELIEAMKLAADRDGLAGAIRRNEHLGGKEYTNFVRVLDQLGVITQQSFDGVSFDLTGVFQIPGLGPIFSELLALKLRAAGWTGTNKLEAESIALNLHEVFGLSSADFVAWLTYGAKPPIAEVGLSAKDQNFFQQQSEGSAPDAFVFKSGHTDKDTSPTTRIGSPRSVANQLHNDVQNRLHRHLCEWLGAKNVGTELNTGSGTSIDVAARDGHKMIFYEIKTSASVRANIRQALPQLLEYAHWIEESRADEFVVVSHLPVTTAAERYLAHLRSRYGIPISYRQFDIATNRLV